MLESLVELLKLLPLPWIIVALSWCACGYVCKQMWDRGNDLQDKNLADVKEYADKYAALSERINDTLDAFIRAYKGGNKRVR